MTTITYRGEVAATATADRCFLADWLLERSPGDPDLRMLCAMCALAMEIEAGALPGPYRDDLALWFARAMLIDDLEFGLYADERDEALAERFGVPLAQIAAKRQDLAEGPDAGVVDSDRTQRGHRVPRFMGRFIACALVVAGAVSLLLLTASSALAQPSVSVPRPGEGRPGGRRTACGLPIAAADAPRRARGRHPARPAGATATGSGRAPMLAGAGDGLLGVTRALE